MRSSSGSILTETPTPEEPEVSQEPYEWNPAAEQLKSNIRNGEPEAKITSEIPLLSNTIKERNRVKESSTEKAPVEAPSEETAEATTTKLFSSTPENRKPYENIYKEYLLELQTADPKMAVEQFTKAGMGLNETQRYSELNKAFNYQANKINTDADIYQARGYDKAYEEYAKAIQTIEDVQAQIQAKGGVENLSEEEKQAFAPVLQSASQVINAIESDQDLRSGIDKWVDISKRASELQSAQQAAVKDHPEIAKKMAEVKVRNILQQKGVDLPGETQRAIYNTVVDNLADLIELTVDVNNPSASYSPTDHAAGKLKDFTENYIKVATSDIPLVNKDGSVNYYRIGPRVAETATDMAMLLVGGEVTAPLKAVMGAKKAADTGIVISSFVLSYSDYKQQAIDNGYSEKDAENFAVGAAGISSLLESVSPNYALRGTTVEKEAVEQALKTLTPSKAIDTFTKIAIKEPMKEMGQEFTQSIADKITGAIANSSVEGDQTKMPMEDELTREELKETAILTWATTALLGGATQYSNQNAARQSALYEASKNVDKFKEIVGAYVEDGKLTAEKAQEIITEVEKTSESLAKIPEEIDEEKKAKIIPVLNEKSKIEEEAKSKDSSFKDLYKEKIQQKEEEIKSILDPATEPVEKPTEKVEEVTGVEVEQSIPPQDKPETDVVEPVLEPVESKEEGAQEEPVITPAETVESAEPVTEVRAEESQPVEPLETTLPPKEKDIATDGPKKTLKAVDRLLKSEEVSDEIKEGVKELGTEYVPIKLDLSESEAKAYVDLYEETGELDRVAGYTKDLTNGMKRVVRGHVAMEVFKRYSNQAQKVEGPEKRKYSIKAAEIAQFAATQFKEAGQEINAAKAWKRMFEKTPEGAVYVVRQKVNERNEKLIERDVKEIKGARKELLDEILKSEEFKSAVESKVSEEIEKRGEKIFGKEQKKKLDSFFDSLKINTKDKAFDATIGLPIAVYNGSIEAIKQTIFLGGNVANAIQAGIEYIKKNHSGDWDEKKYRDDLETKLEGAPVKIKKGRAKAKKSKEEDISSLEKIVKAATGVELLKEKPKVPRKSIDITQGAAEVIVSINKKLNTSSETSLEKTAKEAGKQSLTPKKRNIKAEGLNEIEKSLSETAKDALGEVEGLLSLGYEFESLVKQAENDLKKVNKSRKPKEKPVEPAEEQEITRSSDEAIDAFKKAFKDKEAHDRILNKWEKRLKRMKPENRKKLLADSLKELSENGALSEERFKEMYAEAIGLETINADVEKRIRDLMETIGAAEKAGERYSKLIKEGAPAEEKGRAKHEYVKATWKARYANDKLSDYFREEKDVWDTMSTILQGNLLTSISLITNVYSNLLLQPLRFSSRGVASSLDYLLSQGAKHTFLSKWIDKDRTIDLIAATKGAWKGAPKGTREGFKELVYGLTSAEVDKRDLTSKLEPIKAMTNLWATVTGKNKAEAGKIANDFFEATGGVPAELMFRLLNLGDKPFKRAAEVGKLFEIAKKKKLEGKELEHFLEFPDPESAEEIKKAGEVATYQEDNRLATYVGKGLRGLKSIPVVGRPAFFITKTIFPYLKTPLNIINESMYYAVPEYSAAVALYHIKKGNRKEALEHIGKAVVGAMIAKAAMQLLLNGLITAGADDDEPNERSIQYEEIPPNSINISGLSRMMTGGDPKPKRGQKDIWIDYRKMGVVGALLGMYSEFGKGKTSEEINETSYLSGLGRRSSFTVKTAVETSFLQGTNAIMKAISEGGVSSDKLLVNMTNAIISVEVPNTVTQISRATNEFSPNTRGDGFEDRLLRSLKARFFQGDELPSNITLWGEKVKNVPEGRSALSYMFFDVTKHREVNTGTFGYKLYEFWKETKEDSKVLPSIPQDYITVKKVKHDLTPKQYEDFLTAVGQQRKKLVEAYVNSDSWEKDDPEKKQDKLRQLYDQGRKNGLRLLKNLYPELKK